MISKFGMMDSYAKEMYFPLKNAVNQNYDLCSPSGWAISVFHPQVYLHLIRECFAHGAVRAHVGGPYGHAHVCRHHAHVDDDGHGCGLQSQHRL